MSRRDRAPLPNDGIFRAILIVLVITVLGGAVLALVGEHYFHDTAVKKTGVGIVLIGGFVYFFFRVLGRREAKRREGLDQGARDADDDEGPSTP